MRGLSMSRRAALASGLALATIGGGVARAAGAITMIKAADGRDVRVSIWPAVGLRRGLILFSHGALSAPEKYPRLIDPWVEAGFEVMAPLHVDSTDHPDHAHYDMAGSWKARLLDMRALSDFANAPEYVAAGHSYGGLVALTLGGASAVVPPGIAPPLRDPRAKSVVAFSPPGPAPGLIPPDGYRTVAVPAFIQSGDRDVPFGSKDGRWQVHLAAFDQAPAGNKYALVLAGVDHYFGGLICEPDKPGPPQTEQLAQAVELSIAFLRAFGAHDHQARERLDRALSDSGTVRLARK